MVREREGFWLAGGAVLAAAVACWWITARMALDFSRSLEFSAFNFSAEAGGAVDVSSAALAVDWQSASFGVLFLMWGLMMAAMMLPSFFPTLRAYSRCAVVTAGRGGGAGVGIGAGVVAVGAAALTGGYLLVWLAFSAAAAAAQGALSAAGGLNAALALDSAAARAGLLAAAGVFQFSALKRKCLGGCRHPLLFFILHWKSGARGALAMGARSGLLCLGCCFWLMLLLFAGGVMDLRWIGFLTLTVLAEKTLPLPPLLLARLGGGALLAAAAVQLWTPAVQLFLL